MSVPVLTFFNNKGGVGKTSLVFHLAWMFSELGKSVVVVDLDPQANLTSAFLPEEILEKLWDPDRTSGASTIFQCIEPLTKMGDIRDPTTCHINSKLHLIPGDLALTRFEDALSSEWPKALDSGSPHRPFRVLSSFWNVAQRGASQHEADLVLVDVGPNLGAINRSALIGTDYVVVPLAADLFSLQGLRNLGPTLKAWRKDWTKRLANWEQPDFDLPAAKMEPIGYTLTQHTERLSRPVKAYKKWVDRIPATYRENMLDEHGSVLLPQGQDPYCLAQLKHYRSLMAMAQEAHKPIFHLTAADGAIGTHSYAVQDAHRDFKKLAQTILTMMSIF